MRQKLDLITACNGHEPLLGPSRYGGKTSLSTGNLIWGKTASGKYPSGLGSWTWKKFRGKGKASLKIETFYMPVPPAQGTGPGLVYSQHLPYFNRTNRRIFPRQGFLNYIK